MKNYFGDNKGTVQWAHVPVSYDVNFHFVGWLWSKNNSLGSSCSQFSALNFFELLFIAFYNSVDSLLHWTKKRPKKLSSLQSNCGDWKLENGMPLKIKLFSTLKFWLEKLFCGVFSRVKRVKKSTIQLFKSKSQYRT